MRNRPTAPSARLLDRCKQLGIVLRTLDDGRHWQLRYADRTVSHYWPLTGRQIVLYPGGRTHRDTDPDDVADAVLAETIPVAWPKRWEEAGPRVGPLIPGPDPCLVEKLVVAIAGREACKPETVVRRAVSIATAFARWRHDRDQPGPDAEDDA